MTRFVLGRLVDFHFGRDVIDNAHFMKVLMFFLWPPSMLNLLMRLSVNKAFLTLGQVQLQHQRTVIRGSKGSSSELG